MYKFLVHFYNSTGFLFSQELFSIFLNFHLDFSRRGLYTCTRTRFFKEVVQTSFASRLRQAREQAGFTQQDLAKKLGVTKNAISNYENGVSSPKWEILVEIFDILHVDPNFLYQDDFSSELAEAHVLTPQQSALLAAFDQLNEEGQTKAVEYVEDLVLTGRYKKCPASGLDAKDA